METTYCTVGLSDYHPMERFSVTNDNVMYSKRSYDMGTSLLSALSHFVVLYVFQMRVICDRRQTMLGMRGCAIVLLGVFAFIKSTAGLTGSPTPHTAIMNSAADDEVNHFIMNS